MEPRRDPFRIDLRSAQLCMELDCSTIYDAGRHQHCPACGSAEHYPLESWLNRDRAQGAMTERSPAAFLTDSRARWLERLGAGREESAEHAAAIATPLRARLSRRRAG